MRAALIAGVLYFLSVFALGAALGTLRVLLAVPLLGELVATLAELPMMLAASWAICGWLVRRWRVTPRRPERLTMGAAAFALLMAAEAILSVGLFGRSLGLHLARYGELGPALGLAAQVAFGLFPLVRKTTEPA
jgi:hypothetical protein